MTCFREWHRQIEIAERNICETFQNCFLRGKDDLLEIIEKMDDNEHQKDLKPAFEGPRIYTAEGILIYKSDIRSKKIQFGGVQTRGEILDRKARPS